MTDTIEEKKVGVFEGLTSYLDHNTDLIISPSHKQKYPDKYDSDEEMYFRWYLDELVSAEIVLRYAYQPASILLTKKVNGLSMVNKPTKKDPDRLVEKRSLFLNPHVYTPDYIVVWSPLAVKYGLVSALGVEMQDSLQVDLSDKEAPFRANKYGSSCLYSVIDIKGAFARATNSTAITFPLNQKWVFDKYGLYVQKIIPNDTKGNCLFAKTFTPKRFLIQNKTSKPRKIHFKVKLINEVYDLNN